MAEWLEPWDSYESADESTRMIFADQLVKEVKRGHPLYEVPVRLLARGNGVDVLYEILDGSGRVAVVHLVWQGPQVPPWPSTTIY
jgi:hypothetical protein